MTAILSVLLGALFFGASAYVGILIAGSMKFDTSTLENSPPRGEPPIPFIIAAAALVGAVVVSHAGNGGQALMLALLMVVLAAVWCIDVRFGVVPDILTLVPLAIIVVVAMTQHQWWLFVAILIPTIPFAAAAAFSKGIGMGWGDVKLAALGGAVLGAQTATLAFALACMAAVVVAYMRGWRAGPVAFAPYMAAAIAAAVPIGILM